MAMLDTLLGFSSTSLGKKQHGGTLLYNMPANPFTLRTTSLNVRRDFLRCVWQDPGSLLGFATGCRACQAIIRHCCWVMPAVYDDIAGLIPGLSEALKFLKA